MKFWDASAIIPICLEENHTAAVRKIAETDGSLAVWWGSIIECQSAFARLRREDELSAEETEQVEEVLSALSGAWTEIEAGEDVRDIAMRLLRSHPLRAADALQLAAAIVWADKRPKGHHFVCLNVRLRDAARKEGFSVLPSKIAGD